MDIENRCLNSVAGRSRFALVVNSLIDLAF